METRDIAIQCLLLSLLLIGRHSSFYCDTDCGNICRGTKTTCVVRLNRKRRGRRREKRRRRREKDVKE